MDTAKCTEDCVSYKADESAQLHPADLDRKRRLLQCPECNGPAFFGTPLAVAGLRALARGHIAMRATWRYRTLKDQRAVSMAVSTS